jgi:hypothetical protein
MTVTLREVREEDLSIFFEQQLDAEARRMAAFPGRVCQRGSAGVLQAVWISSSQYFTSANP